MLDILTYPDPRLSQVCAPVEEVTPELRALADAMFETMYKAPGVGLAAPQVGHFIRMLVMDDGVQHGESRNPRVLLNPVLELEGDDVRSEKEGCLSVPLDFRADVIRKSRVHLTARDLDWKPVDEYLDGFAAIIVQHEADHLDGVLFIDRISRLRRSLYDTKVKKWLRRKKHSA